MTPINAKKYRSDKLLNFPNSNIQERESSAYYSCISTGT